MRQANGTPPRSANERRVSSPGRAAVAFNSEAGQPGRAWSIRKSPRMRCAYSGYAASTGSRLPGVIVTYLNVMRFAIHGVAVYPASLLSMAPHHMNDQTCTDSPPLMSPAKRSAYQSPRLSLLGEVCSLTESGSAGMFENDNSNRCMINGQQNHKC